MDGNSSVPQGLYSNNGATGWIAVSQVSYQDGGKNRISPNNRLLADKRDWGKKRLLIGQKAKWHK